MKRLRSLILPILVLLLLLLSACSDGDSKTNISDSDIDGGSSGETTLTGVVADGYLVDARVFLDRNKNHVYDDGEPSTQSTAGGAFSLEVSPGEGTLFPVVVEVIAGQTVDEDSGTAVINGYYLESLPGFWKFISPLTTLVKLDCDKNPSLSRQQAEIVIRSQLGLNDSISLFTNYLTPGGDTADMTEEYDRFHQVARVVAGAMGQLRTELSHNLDGRIDVTEQLPVAYLISDRILWQAPLVKAVLDGERNQTEVIDVAVMVATVVAASNPESLTAEMLARYRQRIEQNFEVWDMQPPQVQTQTPPAGDTASVDAVISITFDEALDETLLSDEVLVVTGPQGVVSGHLDYDAEQVRLTFTPDYFLAPFAHYQVTVAGVLADTLGNPLDEDIRWEFTTIFDQTPPLLPVF